ncbi:ATP-binding protein [Alkalihalobacillus sp. LMS39]|uniref:ATP-binding protein n=1 Tax=Alkalihalobacillus sp. LMS39 TaxID=2924032 RepID=UPI001FB28346|nr:ATP-binding protein [Alkalihalobacillus sp. LMS39]UOE92411.1 ATP-binding protein [Alkalihalobacillus sp. LMS39]
MFWRSVVGKLWFTILLLVSVVLSILMALMLQFFERFHVSEAESQLMNHADMIATIVEVYDDKDMALVTISKIAETYDIKAVILDNEEHWYSSNPSETVNLPISIFYEDPVLSKVFQGDQSVVSQGDFPFVENGVEVHTEIMVVGRPVELNDAQSAVFLYQSLLAIEQTTAHTKRIIIFSAGIAIVLTTIFAFFLSTRITAPLRKMRQAAVEVAEGNFDTKIPILTIDEIGKLAIAFNRMGRELNRNITALNQEKEQLSRILSSMADGVITLDRKGRIVVTNPLAERFIQAWYYEQGLNIDAVEDLPKAVKKLFQQVVVLESEQFDEIDIQGRSWFILMTPLYDQKFVRGAVAVIRDVTEERRHDKLRKDFIANVSHELRTPISMLQGYSEAIVDDIAQTDEEKKEIAQIIYEESLRMGRLVNELLDLARMESGHIELNMEEVNIKDFTDRIIRKFQGLAKEQGIHLMCDVINNENIILFDPDRIEQVLTNLIHNAIRHTLEGGKVQLYVQSTTGEARFDVVDTGSGIPEEDLPFVFERFYKADKARTRGAAGTGLGLAIAKNIVEAHMGHISVHSKVNEGTTFSFSIPRKTEENRENERK